MIEHIFQKLEDQIEKLLQRHDEIKRKNEEKDKEIIKISKELSQIQNQMEKLIKERDIIKKRLNDIIEKIDSSGLI